MGEGFKIRPGGIIGSIAVSCLLLWLYTRAQNRGHEQRRSATTRERPAPRAQGRQQAPHQAVAEAGERSEDGGGLDVTEVMELTALEAGSRSSGCDASSSLGFAIGAVRSIAA